MHSYFDVARPHILAHRGFRLGDHENTVAAFRNAVNYGATHLETDAHVTADGVTVLFHDDTFLGRPLSSLRKSDLPEWIPTLREVCDEFPRQKFNIDIKSERAVRGVAEIVGRDADPERFLLASFSESRRRRTVRLAPRAATSASGPRVAIAVIAAKLHWRWLAMRALNRIDALQIPTRVIGLDTTSHSVIAFFGSLNKVVHYWTINDAQTMRELIERGADGVVTDDTALAVQTIRPAALR